MHFDAHARAHISCVTLLGQFVGHFCGSLRGAALGPWAFVGHFVGHFCGSHAVLVWVTCFCGDTSHHRAPLKK